MTPQKSLPVLSHVLLWLLAVFHSTAFAKEYCNDTFELPADTLATQWLWSQTGGTGSVAYSSTAHGGTRAARIVHSGTGNWTLRHDLDFTVPSGETSPGIPAAPGQSFTVSLWARCTGTTNLELQVVALNGSTVVSSNILPTVKSISGTQAWTQLTSPFTIPPGANGFYVRVVGSNTTDAIIDDLTIVRTNKPLVTGWATTRVAETLDRSVVALRPTAENKVFISWRSLKSDPSTIGFNVYRQTPGGSAVKINSSLITNSTNFVDTNPPVPPALPAPPAGAYYIEAESGTLAAPFSQVSDAGASGGAYIEVDPPGGSTETPPATFAANYTLTNVAAGTYKIWGRVSVRSGQNSFWVRVNGANTNRWLNIPGSALWHWDDVHNVNTGQPLTVTLAAGTHTISVGQAQAGTLLDKLYITKLGDTPTDEIAPYNVTYRVDAVVGSTVTQSIPFAIDLRAKPKDYVAIPVPGSVGKVGVGDLDGDGIYDYVVQTPDRDIDPYGSYWQASGGTYKLHGIKSDGTPLWAAPFDRGFSIEMGVWYAPFIVYDFDGDGKAEVALKTGEGDPRDGNGRVQTGPEYLSILDGSTGTEITRTAWPDRTQFDNYNHYSRNQIGVAFLDGKTPCILAARGTYDDMKLHAFQYKNDTITPLWTWDSRSEGPEYRNYHHQGAHSLSTADVDNDGRDEVILGSCVIDDNGYGLWSNSLGHPDHVYVGELDPANPGMEMYMGIEDGRSQNGVSMWKAGTGEKLWGLSNQTYHIHREGLCADIVAGSNRRGVETRSGEQNYTTRYFRSSTGVSLAENGMFIDDSLRYGAVYWDDTPQKSVVVDDLISKFPDQPISVIKRYTFASSSVPLSNDWQWSADGSLTPAYGSDGSTRLSGTYLQFSATKKGTWFFEHKGVAVSPNEKYFVAMKAANAGAGMLTLRVQGLNGTTVVDSDLLDSPQTLAPGSPWTGMYSTFTIPTGVNQIRMGITGRFTGQIDEVCLVKDPNPNRLKGSVTFRDERDSLAWGDVLGDWREEILTSSLSRPHSGPELRIYSTTIPATSRQTTMMQDSKYRTDVAHQAMGYTQPPTASYLLSEAPVVTEIIVDNTDTTRLTISGTWNTSTAGSGYHGVNYLDDGASGKGSKSVRFTPQIPVTGSYQVFARWPSVGTRANNVPFTVFHAGGQNGFTINQKQNTGMWVSIGTYAFNAGTAGSVLIRNYGTASTTTVLVDALMFVKQ